MARVFLPSAGYGTVSSSIMIAGGALGDRYYFAERGEMLRAHRGEISAQAAYRNLPLEFPGAS